MTPTPPRIPFVPHFVQLADEARCTRMAVAVYGAIVAYQAKGYHPSVYEIGWLVGHKVRSHVHAAIAELVEKRLIRRGARSKRRAYEVLGPTLEMYTQQHGETNV